MCISCTHLTAKEPMPNTSERSPWSLKPGQTWTDPEIGIVFCWIPPGEFKMGTGEGILTAIPEGFWMGRYTVTWSQWLAVMGRYPLDLNAYLAEHSDEEKPNGSEPATVSWSDCHRFLKKLNAKTSSGTYALPTEAQWEYACRAGTTTRFHFGDHLTLSMANIWIDEAYSLISEIKPAGSYPANNWGLYDMHGNVWELCQDLSDGGGLEDFPTNIPPTRSYDDPSLYRVKRGGSAFFTADFATSTSRDAAYPDVSEPDTGFRLVLHPAQRS